MGRETMGERRNNQGSLVCWRANVRWKIAPNEWAQNISEKVRAILAQAGVGASEIRSA